MITRFDKLTGEESLVTANQFMDWIATKTSCRRRMLALAELVNGGAFENNKVVYYIKPIRIALSKPILGAKKDERNSIRVAEVIKGDALESVNV